MTIKEFIEKYNIAKNNEKGLEIFLKEIVYLDKYVPYEKKIAICNRIIDTSYFNHEFDDVGNVIKTDFHMDSTVAYLLTCLHLIQEYTNIDIDFEKNIEQFNELNKYGLIDILLNTIPSKELKEFQMIFNMVKDDLITNEYEIHSFIKNQISKITSVFNDLIPYIIKNFDKYSNNDEFENINELFKVLKS